MPVSNTKIISVKLEVLPQEAIANIQAARKRIDELKADMAVLKITGKGNTEQFIALESELKSLNGVIKANQNVIQNSITAMQNGGESVTALKAQLANLQRAYDDLSETEKNFGEGINLQARIQELNSQVVESENLTGRYGRSVGSYEEAIKAALSGTLPLRSALREVRNELGMLNLQYSDSANRIDAQREKVNELARTLGTQSDEYKNAVQELAQMESEYVKLGNTITDMTAKAGELDDIMQDTSSSIRNAGADAAQWTAAKQGAEVLLNSYTALQAGMVALGIESEELVNIFAKLQVLQQGLNAVNAIAQALQKESILRQQLAVLWNNLTTKSLGSLIAAKTKDTAASAAATVATDTLAAGEAVATTASFTLAGALNAVKTAILNIPIIGWVLAAVAALGSLVALIVKSNKVSEEGIILQEKASANLERQQQYYDEVESKVTEITDNLTSMNRVLETSAKDSKTYKDTLKKLGQEIGVDLENQAVGTETLNKLEEIHIKIKRTELEQEFEQNRYIADRNKLQQINNVLSAAATLDYKQRKQFIEDELGISEKAAASYASAIHNGLKNGKAWQEALADGNDATAKSYEMLLESVDGYSAKAEANTAKIIELSAEMDKIIKEGGLKRIDAAKKASNGVIETAKKELEERRKLEDSILDILEDGIEKQVAVYKNSVDRQIEDLKLKLSTEKNLTIKARNDINRQIEVLESAKEKKIAEIRAKYSREELRQQANMLKERYSLMLKSVNSESEAALTYNKVLLDIQEKAQLDALDSAKEAEDKKLKFYEDIAAQEEPVKKATLAALNLTESEFLEKLQEYRTKQLAADTEYSNQRLAIERYYNSQREKLQTEFDNKKQNDKASAENIDKEAEFSRQLADAELSIYSDKEVQKTKILLQQAEYRMSNAQNEVDRLKSMSSEEIIAVYGTMEAYQLAVSNANALLIEEQNNVKKALAESNAAVQQQKLNTISNAVSIGSAIESVTSNIGGLFSTLAESNDKYNDYATGLAMSQILISSAVSIAQAIQAAVQAGGFTGPAAMVTIPVFIAELVGIVASGIASAVATLNKAKESKGNVPKFATGGLIDSGERGIDRVPILATRGEYIIRKDTVDKVGVDFLDRINSGGIGIHSKGHYALGGEIVEGVNIQEKFNYDAIREAMAEAVKSVTPVVSVKEISNVQNRVRVKEGRQA